MNLGEGINGFGVCMWENEILEGIKYTVQSMKHRLDNMLLFIFKLANSTYGRKGKMTAPAREREGVAGEQQ